MPEDLPPRGAAGAPNSQKFITWVPGPGRDSKSGRYEPKALGQAALAGSLAPGDALWLQGALESVGDLLVTKSNLQLAFLAVPPAVADQDLNAATQFWLSNSVVRTLEASQPPGASARCRCGLN